jgi:hypothetical protein
MTKTFHYFLVALVVAVFAGPPVAAAANVEFRLVADGPSTFKITALVTGADHAGLAGYGFDLLGDVTSLQHLSPGTLEAQSGSAAGPAGFTLARSGDNRSSAYAFQNIADPSLLPIYGMGVQASSFAAEGITPVDTPRSTEWDAEIVLATGSYNGSFDSLAFNPYGPNSGANVFEGVGQTKVRSPEILSFLRVSDSNSEILATIDRLNPTLPVIPEPNPVVPPSPVVIDLPEIVESPAAPEIAPPHSEAQPPDTQPQPGIPEDGSIDQPLIFWMSDFWQIPIDLTTPWRNRIYHQTGGNELYLQLADFVAYDGAQLNVDIAIEATPFVVGLSDVGGASTELISVASRLVYADFDGFALGALALNSASDAEGQLIPEPSALQLLLAALAMAPVTRWPRRSA